MNIYTIFFIKIKLLFHAYNNVMKTKTRSIVLTGGGTAGHVMPNLALVPELKKHFDKIYYFGSSGIEKEILKSHPEIEFVEIPAVKFRRSFSLEIFALPFKLIKAIATTKKLLKQKNPDIIFSKGGYVAIPVAISGKKLKIPVISHESDLSMGLANKIILHYANVLCTSFEATATKKKMIFSGSPVRPEIFLGNGQKERKKLGFDSRPVVLFFGGSIGAMAINKLVWNNILALTKKYNVVHIVGRGNINTRINIQNYKQFEFVSNIQDFFDMSDIAVCRSGANTLFELIAVRLPALLIPLPKLESRGDQIDNARYFEKKGCFVVLEQENATNQKFLEEIDQTFAKKDTLKKNMSLLEQRSANQKIVQIILDNLKT